MATTQGPCPRCGADVPPQARFCPSCGYATARLVPGQTLDGKYEILDKIGEGGMGEVFRARHVHLDEVRIIKVTKPDALGEGAEPRRFQQEARMATLVRHPNVAALYDFSKLPDGSYYMVWEYIDGITLEAWLKRYGALPLPRALDVARQVLAGLSQIHEKGIVHRDLAPDNIMLREGPDGRLHAKIIDLGIAKRVTAETLQMTGTGMFVGKLKYCSPEQAGALPSGQTVDGRSDLYSFGVVLYEMLMGRPPFEAQTPEGYLGQHLHSAAPPLDTSRLPAAAGPQLAAVVKKALEKTRERRFPTAQDFAAALSRLEPYATGRIGEAPTEPMETAEKPRSRWPVAAGVAAAAILALVVAVFALRPRGATPPPTSSAPAPASTAPQPTEPPEDSGVAAPRVVENRAVEDAGVVLTQLPLSPAAEPTALPPPTLLPDPEPPPAEEASPGAAGAPTPGEARRSVEQWRRRGADHRAHTAIEIARMANRFVQAYPGDPFARELQERLPEAFKAGAESAWNAARPLLAALYYRAYRELSFAPYDPELERRADEARPLPRRRRRG